MSHQSLFLPKSGLSRGVTKSPSPALGRQLSLSVAKTQFTLRIGTVYKKALLTTNTFKTARQFFSAIRCTRWTNRRDFHKFDSEQTYPHILVFSLRTEYLLSLTRTHIRCKKVGDL